MCIRGRTVKPVPDEVRDEKVRDGQKFWLATVSLQTCNSNSVWNSTRTHLHASKEYRAWECNACRERYGSRGLASAQSRQRGPGTLDSRWTANRAFARNGHNTTSLTNKRLGEGREDISAEQNGSNVPFERSSVSGRPYLPHQWPLLTVTRLAEYSCITVWDIRERVRSTHTLEPSGALLRPVRETFPSFNFETKRFAGRCIVSCTSWSCWRRVRVCMRIRDNRRVGRPT